MVASIFSFIPSFARLPEVSCTAQHFKQAMGRKFQADLARKGWDLDGVFIVDWYGFA